MNNCFHAIVRLTTVSLLLVFATGCSPRLKTAWHLRRANHYYSAAQWESAEIEYLNVLRNDPRNYAAISRLGEIFYNQGRVEAAGQFLLRAGQLNTNDLAIRVRLGQIFQAAGKLSAARGEAEFVLARQPQNADAPVILAESTVTPAEIAAARGVLRQLPPAANQTLLQVALGILAFREQDFKSAAAAFERAQTLDPKCAMVWSALGVLYQQENKAKSAEAAFKTAADLSPAHSTLRLNYANFEIQTGHPEVADAFLAGLLRETPDYVPAWVLRAKIALADKKYDACAASLAGALARDPENYETAMLSGQLALARGDTAQARTQMEQLARRHPQIPRLHYLLALTSLADHDPSAAMASLNRALTLETNFTDASLLLAQVQMKNGALEPALAGLKRLVQREPNVGQASLLLADAYRAKGQPAEALAIYDRLEQVAPTNAGLSLLKGFTYQEQQEPAAARRAFLRALELAPGDLRALDALVKLEVGEKRYEPAIQVLESTRTNSPHGYEACLWEAGVFEAQGQAGQALAVLQTAIHLNPAATSAHLMLAQHYAREQQLPRALEEVQVVLQAAPGNLEAWLLKSQLLNAANDYPGAAAAYERVLALNPQSGVALNNLACLDSEHLGQLDKAYELAKKARLLQPFDPATADTLGWVLFHKKDYAAARALLQESAARLPRDAAVQLHFGRAAYMQGQEKAATAALQEALRLNPAVEGHEAGRRCLDLLALRVDPVGASPAARATLEKRIAETPDDPVALARLTVLYEQSGETDQAVRAGETLLKVNPDNVKVMLDLARLYEPNLVAKAFEMAKSAYKTAPRDPDTAYLLGRLAGQMQDYKWALSLLKEAAGNQPGNPGIRFDLARAAYRLGKVSEARTAYQSALDLGLTAPRAEQARQALKLIATAESPALIRTAGPDSAAILKTDPDNVPALMVAALVWEQKTNLAAAGQNYEKVLKLHPDFTAAQKNLAGIYARDPQRIQDASALALKAHQASPEDAELTGMLGALLCQQGDYPAAVNHLTRAVSDRPNDPELYYYLGLAQFHLKESAQSKTALRHALELNLSGPPATEARRLLGQMR